MRNELSAYFDDREADIDMLVLHCSALSGADMLRVFDGLKLSTHYIIDENGVLIKCVEEAKSAWHAGSGFWRGCESGFNARSVGIEISSLSLGQEAYSESQIQTLIPLCREIIRRHHIPAVNIVGHLDIAPLRKADPGPAFPWQRLAEEGIGLWYHPEDAEKVSSGDMRELLAAIGYDTRGDEVFKASAYAFCRRFLPSYAQKVNDVHSLLERVLPENFDFMREKTFLQALKAAAYAYGLK